jgi:hypothetical protein
MKELDLPISGEALRDMWEFVRSPHGKYLAFYYELSPSFGRETSLSDFEVRLLWVDVENLQLVLTRTDRGWSTIHPMSVSDDGAVLLMGGKVGKPEGPFQWRCDPVSEYCRDQERFLDDNTIYSDLLDYGRIAENRMYFLSASGELLFSEGCPKGDLFHAGFSADGRRLALQVFKAKGGSSFLDIAPHDVLARVMVYDIPSRRWVYGLDAKKQGIKMLPERWQTELALSPEGSLLGLITQDGVLELYRLPESLPLSSPTQ